MSVTVVTDVSSADCACAAFRLCSWSDKIIAVRRERGGITGRGDWVRTAARLGQELGLRELVSKEMTGNVRDF